MGGKDKIKTELVICGNVVRHAVSFREEEMACSEQESQRLKCEVITDKLSVGAEVTCGEGNFTCEKSEISKQKVSDRLSQCHAWGRDGNSDVDEMN